MDWQQPSAPARPAPGVPADTPRSGVTHVNVRHDSHFTVVGNHLAQHRHLSLLAIGLAVHIQSLPAGTRVAIRTLAERFPDSEHRIGRALRELEAQGYLARVRERLPSGRMVTRTISYNQPHEPVPTRTPSRPQRPRPLRPPTRPRPAAAEPPRPPAAEPPMANPVTPEPPPPPPTTPKTAPEPPPVAEPPHPPHQLKTAREILTALHWADPRLLLSSRDVDRLTPDTARWLERGAPPEAITLALTTGLPPDLRHPPSVIAHRLRELLPPRTGPRPGPRGRGPRPDPLQNCDGCDRAFRSPTPGKCAGCRPAAA
ncbi:MULTISPECIES: helix-turn-helix domain-containing protein [Streptomyces]|uniref:helix-turn-helix domain-containing protein n=1 Tax=Streptomyces TaxID=1883 RepID=UPI001676DE32|nr:MULTISPECIES: helix-turn-helix domain-containing protein [Streptomyces]MBD3579146.1 helix-turn-helix domain-containing protein [Streptomyces sp. KD18]